MSFRATVLTLYPEMFPGPLGHSLAEAVPAAQQYVAGAIRHAPGLGQGVGPLQHFWRAARDRAGRL